MFSSNNEVSKIDSVIDIYVKYIYLNVSLFQCQLATKIMKWMYFIAFSICKKSIRFKIVSFRRMNWLWQFYYNVVPIPYAQKKNCLYLVSKHFLHTQIQFLKGWVDLRGTHMSRCKNPSMWWRYQNHFKFMEDEIYKC